jgi:hypothetical protein
MNCSSESKTGEAREKKCFKCLDPITAIDIWNENRLYCNKCSKELKDLIMNCKGFTSPYSFHYLRTLNTSKPKKVMTACLSKPPSDTRLHKSLHKRLHKSLHKPLPENCYKCLDPMDTVDLANWLYCVKCSKELKDLIMSGKGYTSTYSTHYLRTLNKSTRD